MTMVTFSFTLTYFFSSSPPTAFSSKQSMIEDKFSFPLQNEAIKLDDL